MQPLTQSFIELRGLAFALALLAPAVAQADICADLRTIEQQSRSHFDGWKRDAVGDGAQRQYGASFVLDGAGQCTISGDSTRYSCVWQLASPAALRTAYARLVEQVKACPTLGREQPAILNDEPQQRTRDGVRQTMEITGFDYGDAEVTVLVGRLEASGATTAQSGNQLRLSLSRSVK